MGELIVPQKLETIEADVEKKIFKINGKDFGKDCTGFNIYCNPKEWTIGIEIETRVRYVTYNRKGEKETDHTYERSGQAED